MIKEIIDYLVTKTDLTNLVGTRIFYGLPNSEQTQTYINVNQITENSPLDLQTITRVEFRIIWGDTTINYSTLENIETILRNHILNFTWANVYKIIVSNKVNWYDDKSKKVIVRDFLLFNTN